MSFSAAIATFIALASTLWTYFFGAQLPQTFHARNCQGRAWRRAFPEASKKEIREFLTVFVAAFAFSNKERLKLKPDDLIMQIYRVLYPSEWMPDALEVETLATDVESSYGLKMKDVWHDRLTLGELFANVRMNSIA